MITVLTLRVAILCQTSQLEHRLCDVCARVALDFSVRMIKNHENKIILMSLSLADCHLMVEHPLRVGFARFAFKRQ